VYALLKDEIELNIELSRVTGLDNQLGETQFKTFKTPLSG
jgi:hypothetical protein